MVGEVLKRRKKKENNCMGEGTKVLLKDNSTENAEDLTSYSPIIGTSGKDVKIVDSTIIIK